MGDLLNMTAGFPMNLRPRHENVSSSLEQYCRDTVLTIWHYHGGAVKGKVVDEDYRVIGVDGLRIVDGSTFNQSPGTNPQATVMMLGRSENLWKIGGKWFYLFNVNYLNVCRYMGVKILRERFGWTAPSPGESPH